VPHTGPACRRRRCGGRAARCTARSQFAGRSLLSPRFSSPPLSQKEEAPPPAPSEFDALSLAQLKETVLKLREETSQIARDRNQVATDRVRVWCVARTTDPGFARDTAAHHTYARANTTPHLCRPPCHPFHPIPRAPQDATASFFELTKKELREVELASASKDRDVERLQDAHRGEVRIYAQKVKHLEYEHANAMRAITASGDAEAHREEDRHMKEEALLRSGKDGLRGRLREAEAANSEAVRTIKLLQEKNMQKLRQEFRSTLDGLRAKYEGRLGTLRDDLALRRRVEIHEVEERKNLHLAQLTAAHEQAFAEIKKYYNDITKANLDLITTLKAQIGEANEKSAANQKLMLEIAEENKRLSDPLQRATSELHSLHADLKDADKDRQSLVYTRTRLRSLRAQLAALEGAHAELERRYATVEAERDELYAKFEGTVRAAAARSDQRNEALEKRLGEAEGEYGARRMQVEAVLTAAKLDPHVLADLQAKMDAALEDRSAAIRQLHGDITMLTKATNDAIRTFTVRMRELGVPAEVVDALPLPLLPSTTALGPAGLLSKPAVA
jgi:growth arrest-specific protein 8